MNIHTTRNVPPIVPIVLTQLARRRAAGEMANSEFEQKVERLQNEELERRGLHLLVRELADGRTRFIIEDDATHSIVETVTSAA